MYNDHRNVNRQTWKFTYTGEELLEAAEKKLAFFREKEKAARQEVAKLLQDENVAHDSDDVTKCRTQIASNGDSAEQCSVFVHEFKRSMERKFHLSLGDVVFFGLNKN